MYTTNTDTDCSLTVSHPHPQPSTVVQEQRGDDEKREAQDYFLRQRESLWTELWLLTAWEKKCSILGGKRQGVHIILISTAIDPHSSLN